MTQTGHQANHPLVSVCMLCYNQEQYITEAVEGMLAQTYSPLEIIISDDCSTDRTWEILQKIKDNYTGQHQLAIHRNEKNLRIIRNLCTAFHLAHGELVIKADGDDISMPNRVEKMVEHWLSTNKEAWCLCSAYQKISVEGDIIGHQSVPFTGLDTGASVIFALAMVTFILALHRHIVVMSSCIFQRQTMSGLVMTLSLQ